jgi:hypothetical protein
MEVFDPELHAAYEGLNNVRTMLYEPEHIFLCIDNSSVIEVLSNNPDRIEEAFKTTKVAKLLTNHGRKINTVWVPSHCDIEVKNERDEETCIIIPIVFVHKRKKEIIYIRFPYMKYRRENILHAINLVTTVKERQLN